MIVSTTLALRYDNLYIRARSRGCSPESDHNDAWTARKIAQLNAGERWIQQKLDEPPRGVLAARRNGASRRLRTRRPAETIGFGEVAGRRCRRLDASPRGRNGVADRARCRQSPFLVARMNMSARNDPIKEEIGKDHHRARSAV